MSNSQNAIIKKLSIEGFGEDESLMELGGNITTLLGLDYFEGIFEPITEIKCVFSTIEGALSNAQLRGTELVSLLVEHPTGELEINGWVLTSFRQLETESTVNTFMITCNPSDIIANEKERVTKRYDPKGKSNSHVENILKNNIKTELDLDIEDTANSDGFFGNYWRPYRAIYWLARRALSKSMSSEGGGTDRAGFLFWMTKSGYKFKSIDTIMSEAKAAEDDIPTFTQNEVVDSEIDEEFNLYNALFEHESNVITNMQQSVYGENTKYINIFSLFPDTEVVVKSKVDIKQESLGDVSGDELEHGFDINEKPTVHNRILYVPGTMQMEGKMDSYDDYNPLKVRTQAKMRYESLLSQSLRCTVPYNLVLEAGDVIEADLIQTAEGTDSWLSGYYIIKDLRHSIQITNQGVKCYTHLRLVRDAPGKKD